MPMEPTHGSRIPGPRTPGRRTAGELSSSGPLGVARSCDRHADALTATHTTTINVDHGAVYERCCVAGEVHRCVHDRLERAAVASRSSRSGPWWLRPMGRWPRYAPPRPEPDRPRGLCRG